MEGRRINISSNFNSPNIITGSNTELLWLCSIYLTLRYVLETISSFLFIFMECFLFNIILRKVYYHDMHFIQISQ